MDPVPLDRPGISSSWSRVRVWTGIVLLFAAANVLQLLSYGFAQWWTGVPGARPLPGWLYLPILLSLLAGPSALAALVGASWLSRLYRRDEGTRPPASAFVALGLLALASCYLSVFVSFNVWGT